MTDALKDELWKAAMAASHRAYAKHSQYYVGAALLTERGEIVTGCNVENTSFGLTNCAERTAIFRAFAEGKLVSAEKGSPENIGIAAIAVVNRDGKDCSPCGACRQVLAEFGIDATVLFQFGGKRIESSVRALLPMGFQQ